MTIRHSQGSYPIEFGPLSASLIDIAPEFPVLTDVNVQSACAPMLAGRPNVLALNAGEATKCIAEFTRVHQWLATVGTNRKSKLVVLGGGVIGDLGGFVAATYMRGIPFVQIPTSLLAQVDSSVGGKVGVDLPEGKNLVGAFHAPECVYLDVSVLKTLPKAEFTNGMAEVWKYGFIMDAELVEILEREHMSVDSAQLRFVISRCVALKAEVVEEDEFETTGRRAILNFGHTIGHALEQITGYRELRHGEAVSVGMVAEAKLGEILGLSPAGTMARVAGGLQSQGLPVRHPATQQWEEMVRAMRRDKKTESQQLAFSLLTSVGACKLVKDVEDSAVQAAMSSVK